ncbi:RNA 3'-terminal phosphate cyclase [Desulfogranum mediterraneum]|uniref:RNA 3'-terminal phosphate cyclase n=1 Tax=Desulfogranum mediterraneum TaxID=160661 RepID=UPI000418D139|nr:RNA 3'-terminal phosphate cyclase [Desulfogranum mediterraneum]
MIRIDGSAGEGGGQVLRTALGLSLVTGRAFQITRIRGQRRKPGLLGQHLTAVLAAQEIGQAEVSGAALRSGSLSFRPKSVRGGNYHFSIGTAGSCTLVFQAVMPALIRASGASTIILEGGTHNPFAPTFDYLKGAFLPLLEKLGLKAAAELERPGFYPAGGGRIRITIEPSVRLAPLQLGRCSNLRLRARAICAGLPGQIGRRELKVIQEQLPVSEQDSELLHYPRYGPGNVVAVYAQSDQLTEIFTGFGEKRVRAETVAAGVVAEVQQYLDAGVAVGPHLADQLLIPLALAGAGQLLTCRPTGHTLTNIRVIRQFLEKEIKLDQLDEQVWQIKV